MRFILTDNFMPADSHGNIEYHMARNRKYCAFVWGCVCVCVHMCVGFSGLFLILGNHKDSIMEGRP